MGFPLIYRFLKIATQKSNAGLLIDFPVFLYFDRPPSKRRALVSDWVFPPYFDFRKTAQTKRRTSACQRCPLRIFERPTLQTPHMGLLTGFPLFYRFPKGDPNQMPRAGLLTGFLLFIDFCKTTSPNATFRFANGFP